MVTIAYPPHFRVGREEARGMGIVITRISNFLEEWLGMEGSHLEERRETPKEARWREGMVMVLPYLMERCDHDHHPWSVSE